MSAVDIMDVNKSTVSDSIVDERKNKPPSGAPKLRIRARKTPLDSSHPRRYIVQNFHLIWADADIDRSTQDYQNTLAQLRTIVNNINVFTQLEDCIEFLMEVDDKRVFLILGGSLAQQIVPLVHDIPQLDVIYIFCGNKSKHELWIKRWDKVHGVHTRITPICQSLQEVVKQCNQNSIAMSFLAGNEETSNQNFEQLDTSFIYTQIFKQILVGIEYKEEYIKDFILFWRYHYIENTFILEMIIEFERDYRPQSSIWWYTRDDFVYQILNLAFLRLEANIIFYLHCFLHDLNQQIEQLYREQIDDYHGQPFIVYRGQCLSISMFEKLQKTQGGLVSFNNFLSTSKNQQVSLVSAKSALIQTDMVGILFKMSIDPSISSIPFAAIQEVSYTQTEGEILFSMHTVFRVGEITRIDKTNPLYQVELQLTADDDQQLLTLIDHIQEETANYAGWKQLTQPQNELFPLQKSDLRDEFIDQHTSNQDGTAHQKSGYVKDNQDEYKKAIWCFEKALGTCKRLFPSNHLNFAIIYNNFATVYKNMHEYSKALSFLDKAIEIQKEVLPPNHPDLATSYNNIGVAYSNTKESSKALSSHEKAILIYKKILSPNHPKLANIYDNLAAVYFDMKDYAKALSSHEKALEVKKETIPLNHHDLVNSYSNIGLIYRHMNEYVKALSFHEQALEIRQKHLSLNHSDLVLSYYDIAMVYHLMKEYPKVISTLEKGLEFQKTVFPSYHPSFSFSYTTMATTYYQMKEYSKALLFHEKALEIDQQLFPPKHPHLASSYRDIGRVYLDMGDYSKSLSYNEKALEIQKESLPANDRVLAISYNNIVEVYVKMRDYSKALPFHEKAMQIFEEILPSDDPGLAISYQNIGETYRNLKEYTKALSSHEKALEIQKKILPPYHPDLAIYYGNVGEVYQNMEEYSKSLPYHEKAIEIMEKNLPGNHYFFLTVYNNIAELYDTVGEYSKARAVKKKLRDMVQNSYAAQTLEMTSVNTIAADENNIGKPIPQRRSRKRNGKK